MRHRQDNNDHTVDAVVTNTVQSAGDFALIHEAEVAAFRAARAQFDLEHPELVGPGRTGLSRVVEEVVGYGQHMLDTEKNCLTIRDEHPVIFGVVQPGFEVIEQAVSMGKGLLRFFDKIAKEPDQPKNQLFKRALI